MGNGELERADEIKSSKMTAFTFKSEIKSLEEILESYDNAIMKRHCNCTRNKGYRMRMMPDEDVRDLKIERARIFSRLMRLKGLDKDDKESM